MVDLGKVVEWLKLPTKALVGVCVASGILLFSTDELLRMLGLQTLVAEYRPYVGVVFLLSLVFVLVSASGGLIQITRPWVVDAYRIRIGKKRLQNLNPEERQLLAYYIKNQTRSQSLDVKSGTVNALAREHIIIRGSNLGTYYGFDYIIQPWAWEYLNKNPHLLE